MAVQLSTKTSAGKSSNVEPNHESVLKERKCRRFTPKEDTSIINEAIAVLQENVHIAFLPLFEEVAHRLNAKHELQFSRTGPQLYRRFHRLIIKAKSNLTDESVSLCDQDKKVLDFDMAKRSAAILNKKKSKRKSDRRDLTLDEIDTSGISILNSKTNMEACERTSGERRSTNDPPPRKRLKTLRNTSNIYAKQNSKENVSIPLSTNKTHGLAILASRNSACLLENKASKLTLDMNVVGFSTFTSSKSSSGSHTHETVPGIIADLSSSENEPICHEKDSKDAKEQKPQEKADHEIEKLQSQVRQLRLQILHLNLKDHDGNDSSEKTTYLVPEMPKSRQQRINCMMNTVMHWSRVTPAFLPLDVQQQVCGHQNESVRSLSTLYKFLEESISKGMAPLSIEILRKLFHVILSNMNSASGVAKEDDEISRSLTCTLSLMTRVSFSKMFKEILAFRSKANICWAFSLTENVIGPLLQHSKTGGTHSLHADISSLFIDSIAETANIFNDSSTLNSQVQSEVCARALEVSGALSGIMDFEIAKKIPSQHIYVIGSRNALFSMTLSKLQEQGCFAPSS